MDWLFYLGLVLLIVGALAFLGFKLLPVKKHWNIIFIIAGLLIVTGFGATLWSGIQSLAVASPDDNTNTAPSANAYSYSVLATRGNANFLLDENARVITIPETVNTSATTVNYADAQTNVANFTIGITDPYADMRGVSVSCSTPVFYNQNVSVSDSTQYLIVDKDTAGLADIRIADSTGAYQRRSRTFLLGGQASSGQSITVVLTTGVDATAVSKLNQYNSQDITCNVAGQTWAVRVQKTSSTA